MTPSLVRQYSRISDSKYVTLAMMGETMGQDVLVRMNHYKRRSKSKKLHAMIDLFISEYQKEYFRPKLVSSNDDIFLSKPSQAKLSLVG